TAPADDEDDDRRRRWPWVLLGVLLVVAAIAGGTIAYLVTRTITHEVPDVRGQSVEQLAAIAAENDWTLGEEQSEYSADVPLGAVVRTDPPAGERLEEGGTLLYWVSLGPEPVDVPDVRNMTLDEAATALQAAGLVLATDPPPATEHHEDVAEGRIIRRVGEEPRLVPGTPVQVVVSAGPAPRELTQDLFGAPYAQVEARLAEMRVTPERVDEHHETVPEGAVIGFRNQEGADVGPGGTVPRDSTVQVIVSRGPAPRPVPDVEGMTYAEAKQILEAAGFTVVAVGDTDTRVFASSPRAGTVQPKGTRITLFMPLE
ncbi:MAG TPA: PASTA domain-containing protein, partial [Acidimicrobiales bacterium]